MAVLGCIVGSGRLGVVVCAGPEGLRLAHIFIPRIVTGVKTVGNHQLRQARSMRVMALGTGEGVVTNVNCGLINRNAPLEICEERLRFINNTWRIFTSTGLQ